MPPFFFPLYFFAHLFSYKIVVYAANSFYKTPFLLYSACTCLALKRIKSGLNSYSPNAHPSNLIYSIVIFRYAFAKTFMALKHEKNHYCAKRLDIFTHVRVSSSTSFATAIEILLCCYVIDLR